MTDLTFVHITDLHISTQDVEGEMLLGDTTAVLKRTFSEIRRMNPAPQFIVASGDLTNRGDAASYEILKSVIAAEAPDVPLFLALGNHDSREGFCAAYPDLHGDPSKPYDHDAVTGGLHVIVMDSSVPRQIGGYWEEGQIDWLKARLAAHLDLPKLLVMHHAPMVDPSRPDLAWESLSESATEALRETIAGHNVIGILSGHVHLDRVSHWYGVPVFIGAGHHAATDPLDLSEHMDMLDGTGFAIGTARPSGLTVTYVPHPQKRELRHRLEFEVIRQHLAAMDAAE